MKEDKPRAIIIGLDGATFKNLKPWMDDGLLPNLKHLVENGASGILKSTVPWISSSAWPSFMTGVNPGKHGVFGFIKPFKDKRYKKELHTSKDIKAKTIFEILSECGKISGVINLPMTYPSFEINGFMITCGITTPSTDFNFTYPEDLFEKNNLKRKEYILNVSSLQYSEDEREQFFLDLIKCAEKRKEVSFKLMDAYDWDLVTLIFGGTDRLQHFYWHCIDPTHPKHNPAEAKRFLPLIIKYYQKLDAIIGEFINLMDEKTSLFIISDHGFGPTQTVVSLHKLLEQNGLLHYKNESMPKKVKGIFNSTRSILHKNSIVYRKTKELVKPVGRIIMGKLFKKEVSKRKIKNTLGAGLDDNYWQKIDWKKTAAYAGYTHDTAYLNLKDREPEGSINSDEEYQQVRNKIIDFISNLKAPETGKKLKVKVYKKEEIYSGPYAGDGCDLCFDIEDGKYVLRSYVGAKEVFSDSVYWTGAHTRDGIVIAYGDNFKKLHSIRDAQIIDIAPTILYLLGVPISDGMDGKVLEDAINDEYIKQTPVKYQKLSGRDKGAEQESNIDDKEDMSKVEKRLADLGYI